LDRREFGGVKPGNNFIGLNSEDEICLNLNGFSGGGVQWNADFYDCYDGEDFLVVFW
jgi:hypothetical protein